MTQKIGVTYLPMVPNGSEPKPRPRQFGRSGILCTIALIAPIFAAAAYAQTSGTGSAEKSMIESARAECADRLSRFVRELDEMLTKDPPALQPVRDLLDKYLPLKGCDVAEAIKICRSSKYFAVISPHKDSDAILFNSSSFWNRHSGFQVGFAIRKPSGDTELPHAKINK